MAFGDICEEIYRCVADALQRTTQRGFPDVGALLVAAAHSCRGLLGHTEYMETYSLPGLCSEIISI